MSKSVYDFIHLPLTTTSPNYDGVSTIRASDGVIHRVRAGKAEFASGRWCLVALQLEIRGVLQRLRFRDNSEFWVRLGTLASPERAVDVLSVEQLANMTAA
ncbi:hypothetical protein [Zavarzinella formosa]|uniref:hypothetical protein n=1 Tax=Zavarzinella formosa TaxID=360055 RepID=UPI00035C24E4|nr:hypothetical protein [Zavarzinella formosa]